MTKAEALYTFFASFGIPAYAADFVPDGAPFPRITYGLVTGDYGAEHSVSASLWYRTDTLTGMLAMVERIAETVGLGGVKLPCDGGHIHLYRGTPWAQLMRDPDDDKVKREYLNFTARCNTAPVSE